MLEAAPICIVGVITLELYLMHCKFIVSILCAVPAKVFFFEAIGRHVPVPRITHRLLDVRR
jgi:hypothetical protein